MTLTDAPPLFPPPARLGILGGMGPAATADFYAKLVRLTPAARDQDHIPVLMEADPGIPDRSDSFLHGGPSPLPALTRGALALEAGGAALVAMPCNTAHLWHPALQARLGVPLLHIVDAVVADLRRLLPRAAGGELRVGLLGTPATVRSGLYPRRAGADHAAAGWQWIAPSPQEQAGWVDTAIAAVKSGQLAQAREAMLEARQALLRRGVDAIAYACTEVPLALAGVDSPVAASDSTEALARLAVQQALARGR